MFSKKDDYITINPDYFKDCMSQFKLISRDKKSLKKHHKIYRKNKMKKNFLKIVEK